MNRTLITLFALALLSPAPGGAAERLRIGMPTAPPALVNITPYLAQALGYFRAEGLDVTISEFRGGTAAHQALVGVGSDLDIADIPAPFLFAGIAKGSGVKLIYSFAPKNEALFVTAPEVTSVAGLRGKRVGIEGEGGYSHLAFQAVAEPAGISDRDVILVRTPAPLRVLFLLRGQADAVVIHIEQFYQVQRQRPVNELARFWRMQPDYLYAAFAARVERLRDRRDVYVKAVGAMIRANRFLYDPKNKPRVLDIAETHTKAPRWALDHAYDILTADHIWSVDAGLPARAVAWTNDFNARLGRYADGKPAPDALVDLSIAEQALRSIDAGR